MVVPVPRASEHAVDVVPENRVVPCPPGAQFTIPRPVGLLKDSSQFGLLTGNDGLGFVVAIAGTVGHLHPSLASLDVYAIITHRDRLLCALLSLDPKCS